MPPPLSPFRRSLAPRRATSSARDSRSLVWSSRLSTTPAMQPGLAAPTDRAAGARNCPQLLKPRAYRSTFCSLTAFSNSPRENTFNTCEKMLHTFSRLSFLTLNWFLTGTHSNVLGIHPLASRHSLRPGHPGQAVSLWSGRGSKLAR